MKNRNNLKTEGYWKEKDFTTEYLGRIFTTKTGSNYPIPIPNVLTESQSRKVYDLIIEKESIAQKVKYKGFSWSRITNETLGCAEYWTDEWKWPADFAKHYVLDHKVKPTDEFLKYIGYEK